MISTKRKNVKSAVAWAGSDIIIKICTPFEQEPLPEFIDDGQCI